MVFATARTAQRKRWSARCGALICAALSLFPALLPASASALESTPEVSPRATVTLVSDAASVSPGQTFRVGLRQKLAPGWHTYWKNPGDAGAAPNIALKLPDGATSGSIQWPGPSRFAVGPVTSFGYETEVVFPIAVTVPDTAQPGQMFPIEAEADWLVCERECIPESGTFRLELPVAASPSPANTEIAASFATSDARRPVPSPWSSRLAADGEAITLTVEGEGLGPASVKEAFFYPSDWGVIVHSGAQKLTIDDGRLTLAIPKGEAFNPQASAAGLLAVTDGGGQIRWFEIAPAVSAAPLALAANPSAIEALPLWQIALFAFLGGLLLNLMPCVFPVLAIKATAIAKMSGGDLRDIRLASAFYTLGVLVAFVALAGLLLGVRASGAAVGWGFQFQSPVFVAAMSWLLLAIGLNLSGVYEIGLGVTGAGQGLTRRSGHSGSFFTGMLAVVVATPCTAPFMGAALGAALTAPIIVCLLIFLAMGLGLAAPYALLGAFPRLAGLLPRPGPWMVRLRQGLAFLMYASAAWLVWVLTQQVGDFGVVIALAGALLISLAAWIYGIAQQSTGRGLLARGLAAGAVIGTLALLLPLDSLTTPGNAARTPAAAATASDFEPFSNARLADLRTRGKPVFVNMTAAWCITCLVNEKTTLSADGVKQTFDAKGITYLKGDWTNRDPEITAFLRSFNRDGLPFYVFYPAGGRDPVVLPSVLTETLVLGEIDRAMN